MSYLETLQRHNAELEALIDVANSLPEADGESGGDIPAVVQPLEVTENGTYTAPDGVDGYSPVTVNVAGPSSEELTVDLNFANGDMTLEPEDDAVYDKVTISKPDTLVPENIADGVDIAGILGTFVGDGDKPKMFMKEFTPNANTYTGVMTIATAEELASIGFANGSRRFAMVIPAENDRMGTSYARSIMCNLITDYTFMTHQSGTRNCLVVSNYLSNHQGNVVMEHLYKAAFSGNVVQNTIFYADGEIRYDTAGSTYLLRLGDTTYTSYYLIAGVLS